MSNCKHNWTEPPECPQCIRDERDELKKRDALELIALQNKKLRSQLAALMDVARAASMLMNPNLMRIDKGYYTDVLRKALTALHEKGVNP